MADRVWTVLEMLRWTTDYLGKKHLPEPRLNAEILLAGALDLKRLELYLQFDRSLSAGELADFRARLLRRARHEPLQYIAGHTQFRDLRLRVDHRVLIPRPETEELVSEVLAWAAGKGALRAVDVGTGSGAIALCLATEGSFEIVVATDLSADALAVARENHALAAPGSAVDFRLGSVLEPVAGERFDLIVSNPPYIGERERGSLDLEVREWEPAAALFAGDDGTDVIRALVEAAPDHLRPGGMLALEIGASQADAVAAMIRDRGAFEEPRIRRDLAGRDRIVLAGLRR